MERALGCGVGFLLMAMAGLVGFAAEATPEICLRLRVHGLKSEVPEVDAAPDEAALKEMVVRINEIWAPARIRFELESVAREDARDEDAQRAFAALTKRTGREAGPATARTLARMVPRLPSETGVFHVVLVRRFPMGLGGRYFPELGYVVTPQVVPRRPGPPPEDDEEPVATRPLEPKVMAHELGHALSLRHVALAENLMTSGPNTRGITRGEKLNDEQVAEARQVAAGGKPFLLPEPPASRGRPKARLTKAGRLLLDEDFAGDSLPGNWRPAGRSSGFSVADGALRGACAADDSRGPVIVVPVDAHDLTLAFSTKFLKPGGLVLVLDGKGQFSDTAHLLDVALNPGGVSLRQERGNPATRPRPSAADRRGGAPGRPPPTPTKEQLADPGFFRVEPLASKPAKLDDGAWHHVLVEVSGNDVLVHVGENISLYGAATVLDVEKHRMAFLVGQAGTVLIDDVKLWENSPLPDAPARKAKLAAPEAGKP